MRRSVQSRFVSSLVQNPLLVILIIVVIGVEISTGSLLQWQNIRGILQDGAVIAIVAIPVAMLLISGYIDLSMGSSLALGGVVASLVMDKGAGNPIVGILLAVGAGVLVGLFNAIATCILGLNSFITTLGTLTAVRGVAQLLSPLPKNSFGDQFGLLGVGTLAGVPISVWIAGTVLVLAGVFLAYTPIGRHVYAIGVNREAAFLSGVNTRWIPFFLFILAGGLSGFAGTVVVARLNSAPAGQLGVGFELTVLTAVLLGGVALTGGEGNMFGVMIGVLFLGVLTNSLTLLGVTTFWQSVASGLALVAAIALSAGTHKIRLRIEAKEAKQAAAQISAPA